MATTATYTQGAGGTHRYTWVLTDGETGDAVSLPGAADRTIQTYGTFSSGVVTLNGTLAESSSGTYIAITDAQGTAISQAAAGIDTVGENCTWYQPVVTGGSSSSITIILLSRRTA